MVYECARFLAARPSPGHEVHIYASHWEPIPGSNVYFHPVDIPQRPAFLAGRRYFDAASRLLGRHDVLNTHGCVCPVGGVHWVQSVHAAWLQRARSMRPPLSLARLKQRLNPVHPILLKLEERHFAQRHYQKLIATTPQVVRDLQHFYGVPPEDVVIIPNGFNPDEFNPARRAQRRAAMRRSLSLADHHIVLLMVANELERKGFFVLLKALQKIANDNVHLLVAGRSSVAQVQREARRAGLSRHVHALGPSSDVAALHAAADLMVLPTQYEAFSLAILEALGSGLPVVATAVPGAADALVPGVNGYVQQNPLDAGELAALLTPLLSHERLAALSATTPATVRHYQWPQVLQRYEQVLLAHA